MTDTPQLSGKDLAFQALAAYKATARTTPTAKPARAKTSRMARTGDRRDPMSLADAIAGLNADLPLEAGVSGGTVLDQWTTLCPQYDGLVQAVAYDDTRGRLDVRPTSHAYAAQLRLLGGQVAKHINDKMGRVVVRTIRVLPVGAIEQPAAYTAVYAEPSTEAPVKTRETASPGYRAALEAALTHRPDHAPTDPYTVEAMRRQEAALRAGRQPESEHREAVWADDATPTGPAPGSLEESLARARAYARDERAGQTSRRAFDAA
jgi:hypothetical protein